MNQIILDGQTLNPLHLWTFVKNNAYKHSGFEIIISDSAKKNIQLSSDYVAKHAVGSEPIYGINTGFGRFAEVSISKDQLQSLQKNLILSHCCGVGELLSREVVFCMWLLRLNTFCRGRSGIRLGTIEKIIQSVEKGILCNVPARGSVGASGDLAPSAHASLVLLGEGDCTYVEEDTEIVVHSSTSEALDKFGLSPIDNFSPKEGLALINGTQLTTALCLKAWAEATILLDYANLNLALTVEGLQATPEVLDRDVLFERNHPGTVFCGEATHNYLEGTSQIREGHKDCGQVQDPYSIRCAPQVHGCLKQDLDYVEKILESELNSSTDNPLVFHEKNKSQSGGNFHAIYTAKASDQLASAITTLAAISERRTSLAMSTESSKLPAFLTKHGGLHSGLMMAQVTAAALTSENKSLSFPASVDSIPTSGDREDHVSMGPIAGKKATQIASNTFYVLAIEHLTMFQAIDLLSPLKSSNTIEQFKKELRKHVPFIDQDRIFSTDLEMISSLIRKDYLNVSRFK